MAKHLSKDFFKPLIDKAVELVAPKKIILFGSFARGDQKEKSDIDLAFEFDQRPENWPVFKSWVDDDFQTLRELDLVILDEADDSIVESIQKEGIIIYEQ